MVFYFLDARATQILLLGHRRRRKACWLHRFRQVFGHSQQRIGGGSVSSSIVVVVVIIIRRGLRPAPAASAEIRVAHRKRGSCSTERCQCQSWVRDPRSVVGGGERRSWAGRFKWQDGRKCWQPRGSVLLVYKVDQLFPNFSQNVVATFLIGKWHYSK